MNQKNLDRYRQRLLDLRADIASRASALSEEALRGASGDTRSNMSKTPVHLGDTSSDQYEQEIATSLLRTEREIEGEIVEALNRIEEGSFGRCEECGQDIPDKRLEALPYARYCINCSQLYEPGS